MLCTLFLFAGCAQAAYNFLGIGDWGGAAINEQDANNVYAVATQMAKVASQYSPKFIVNTGDNFYWCGIQNTSDFQIQVDYVSPYSAKSLDLPWYNALGNHEYGYNVDAQIDYAKLNNNWIMDARYYTRRIVLDSSKSYYMTVIYLDTSPCISAYRSSSPSGWDPCSTKYPTCSLTDDDDDFEGPCMFHSNILSQDCSTQYSWLQSTLSKVNPSDWLLVVGHHPIDEVDVIDFTTLLQQHGFSLYMNGHSHTLAQYTIDGKGAYITTGAGALVNTADQFQPLTRAKVAGDDIAISELAAISQATHSYKTVFNSATAGFTHHTFSSDFSTLQTDYISYKGTVLHSFKVNKAGVVL